MHQLKRTDDHFAEQVISVTLGRDYTMAVIMQLVGKGDLMNTCWEKQDYQRLNLRNRMDRQGLNCYQPRMYQVRIGSWA
jgi:hypothetical protein